MFRLRDIVAILAVFLSAILWKGPANAGETWKVDVPQLVLQNISFTVVITAPTPDEARIVALLTSKGAVLTPGSKTASTYTFSSVSVAKSGTLMVLADDELVTDVELETLPRWLSLLPVIVAIFLALTLRQVIPAIFAGLWCGAALANGLHISSLWHGLLDTVAVYILAALADADHMSIILFSLLIGGLVAIINKNGGMAGIVAALLPLATTRERGQVATTLLGTAIFFDDYANTMVVGNTMRPITDRLKISREKLAYLVDSTAAPIASIGLITTWIGFQVGLLDDATKGLEGLSQSAYSIFLNSIPYAFYSILAIFFVYLISSTGRDFGAMRSAEEKALAASPPLDTEEVVQDGPRPRALNAIIPLCILIFGTLVGIYVTGKSGLPETAGLRDIIGNGNSYQAMVWASTLAVLVAIVMSVAGKTLALAETIDALVEGIKTMTFAIIILTLAWALSGVNDALHTAEFLSSALSDRIAPPLLPLIVFMLAAAMAFATGSSWGVMGILIPLTIPLTWAVLDPASPALAGLDPAGLGIFYASVAALLSGAVWGDHCSPISDTTILSSMASGCDHIEHVRTQLPYAFVVAAVAIFAGALPAGFGFPPWASLVLGGLALFGILKVFGRRPAI